MALLLVIISVIIFACVAANKLSRWMGMPALLLFLVLGMLFGTDGPFKVDFQDYELTNHICSTALAFIMFYGGFSTNWNAAKRVAGKASLLATGGVAVTALLIGVFCHFVLSFSLLNSFLTGAVISSTDAASVFSILRSKSLSLKDSTDSLLEVESGSNDPIAYLLTFIALSLIHGGESTPIWYLFFGQVVYGVVLGIAIPFAALFFLRRSESGEDMKIVFFIAIALISFALPNLIGGNGFLSVYLTGLILGNSKLSGKVPLVHFFSGVTSLAQIVIFFLLGFLATPHLMPRVLLPAILIALFIALVARPIATFLLMLPMGCHPRQCLLISWAGLRGAASIVFAIIAMVEGAGQDIDLFHIVFIVALFSVAVQGTLLPFVARKLNMVDTQGDVRKTFNDYQAEDAITLMQLAVPPGHNWEDKLISEVSIPTGSLALMIRRGDETITPKGDTRILTGDTVVLSVPAYHASEQIRLREIELTKNHHWCGRKIADLDLPKSDLIVLIRRGEENIIPSGQTELQQNDVAVLYRQRQKKKAKSMA